MKANRVHEFGPPASIVWEEVARPVPAEGQVLIRVKAAGVGPWDALVRTGKSGLPQPLPLTLGAEISGRVETLGAGVTGLAMGDEVFGATNARFTDGYAEYVAASAELIAKKPRSVDHVEAASLPIVAVTAWQMLFDHAQLTAGQTLLVLGAHGNVGSYVVQLATWKGASAIATTIEEAREPVDVVIDTVGGEAQKSAFAVLKKGGALVSVVSQPDAEEAAQRGVRASYFIVKATTGYLKKIGAMIDAGELRTHVGTVLPMAEAVVAHEMLAGTRAHPRGKIVLSA